MLAPRKTKNISARWMQNTCENLTHLANEEWVSRFKSHELVEVEENIEEMPGQFAPPEVFYGKKGIILKKQHTYQLKNVQDLRNCTKIGKVCRPLVLSYQLVDTICPQTVQVPGPCIPCDEVAPQKSIVVQCV